MGDWPGGMNGACMCMEKMYIILCHKCIVYVTHRHVHVHIQHTQLCMHKIHLYLCCMKLQHKNAYRIYLISKLGYDIRVPLLLVSEIYRY